MDIDINTLRVAVTLCGFVLFALLVAHSYSRKRRSEHEAAAMLPFIEDKREPGRE